uniref:Uncharacterized protein n=1 Tax=Plectus sambesii TaxID=2011161 RepID=A0A914XHT4_9BILA
MGDRKKGLGWRRRTKRRAIGCVRGERRDAPNGQRKDSREIHVSAMPTNLNHRAAYRRDPISILSQQEGICMSTTGFMTFLILALVLLSSVIVAASYLLLRPSHKE